MLLAGEIGKPHGLRGEVYVVRISDDPRRFEPGGELSHSDGRILVVESVRTHRDRLLVKFVGIETRSDAEGLRGSLYAPDEARRDLDEDEFWVDDLVGLDVVLPGGDRAGRVVEVVEGPAHDQLVVETPRGSRLVPLVGQIVTDISLEDGVVTLDPPEGLLE